ncbi:MAG: hypothetical protein KGM49_04815 [Sphingomonadales bacterium]|nr:hypothetical protein [Sphingomonadales bacterium]
MSTASPTPDTPARARRGKQRKQVRLPARLREQDAIPGNRHWRTYFLDHLVITSNVTASAKEAGVSISRVYRTRQDDPDFARDWRVALVQGYENLEMELLCHLRNASPDRKMDVANCIRLLASHRAEVARQRALEDNCSEQDVLESIDAMIEDMRQRAAANSALIDESKSVGNAR